MPDGSGGLEETITLLFKVQNNQLQHQLDKINRSVHGSADKMRKDLEKGLDTGHLSKALDKVFDSSRITMLRMGEERLRIFGSALEPLGAAGIAAGVGIGAFYAAMEMASKSVEFATELQHLSDKLGVTTEQVQRFDYVFAAAGIPIDKGREALQRLNEIFGQAQSGVLRPQSMKAFQALGFTQDQLLKFHSVSDFLAALPAAMARAGSAAEQAGIAKRLGIEDLIPLLREGKGGLADLTAQTASYGVMSDQAVAHAAALNKELQVAKQRVHEAALSFGADFAPALVAVQKIMLGLIETADKLWRALDPPESKRIADELATANEIEKRFGANDPRVKALRTDAARRQGVQAQDLADQKREQADANAAAKADIAAKAPKAGRVARAPRDTFGSQWASATGSLEDAARAYLESLAALTKDTAAHAAIEKKIADDELAKAQAETDAKIAKIQADKGLTAARKAELVSALEEAQLGRELAAQNRQRLVDLEAADAAGKARVEQANAERQAQIDMLDAQKALATTAKARQALDLKILDLQEQIYVASQKQAIAAAAASGDQVEARRLTTELNGREATFGLRQKAVGAGPPKQSPYDAYLSKLSDATGANVGDSLQTIAVTALEHFNSQLTTAIVNGRNLGDVFGNVARQIESDLINLALEKYLTLPLAQALGLAGGQGGLLSIFSGGAGGGGSTVGVAASSFDGIIQAASGMSLFAGLPAFAGGTDFAPGGMALVGENGPELVNLPRGSQVIPNNRLNAVSVAPGMSVASPSISFDLRGAVMTADLLSQMNAMAASAERRATVNGAALGAGAARTLVPQAMARAQSLQIPRGG